MLPSTKYAGKVTGFLLNKILEDAKVKAVPCSSCKKLQAARTDASYRAMRALVHVAVPAGSISTIVLIIGSILWSYRQGIFGAEPAWFHFLAPILAWGCMLSLMTIAAYCWLAWIKRKARFTCAACHKTWTTKNGPGFRGMSFLIGFLVMLAAMAGVWMWAK